MSSCSNRIAAFNNLFALTCSQPREKENCAHNFLLFKYFLNNLLLTIFMQNTHCYKKCGHVSVQHPFRNMCAKFKVHHLSRFRTAAGQVFTIQKPFLSEVSLTMKTAVPNSL